jgi:hypothetical protein
MDRIYDRTVQGGRVWEAVRYKSHALLMLTPGGRRDAGKLNFCLTPLKKVVKCGPLRCVRLVAAECPMRGIEHARHRHDVASAE